MGTRAQRRLNPPSSQSRQSAPISNPNASKVVSEREARRQQQLNVQRNYKRMSAAIKRLGSNYIVKIGNRSIRLGSRSGPIDTSTAQAQLKTKLDLFEERFYDAKGKLGGKLPPYEVIAGKRVLLSDVSRYRSEKKQIRSRIKPRTYSTSKTTTGVGKKRQKILRQPPKPKITTAQRRINNARYSPPPSANPRKTSQQVRKGSVVFRVPALRDELIDNKTLFSPSLQRKLAKDLTKKEQLDLLEKLRKARLPRIKKKLVIAALSQPKKKRSTFEKKVRAAMGRRKDHQARSKRISTKIKNNWDKAGAPKVVGEIMSKSVIGFIDIGAYTAAGAENAYLALYGKLKGDKATKAEIKKVISQHSADAKKIPQHIWNDIKNIDLRTPQGKADAILYGIDALLIGSLATTASIAAGRAAIRAARPVIRAARPTLSAAKAKVSDFKNTVRAAAKTKAKKVSGAVKRSIRGAASKATRGRIKPPEPKYPSIKDITTKSGTVARSIQNAIKSKFAGAVVTKEAISLLQRGKTVVIKVMRRTPSKTRVNPETGKGVQGREVSLQDALKIADETITVKLGNVATYSEQYLKNLKRTGRSPPARSRGVIIEGAGKVQKVPIARLPKPIKSTAGKTALQNARSKFREAKRRQRSAKPHPSPKRRSRTRRTKEARRKRLNPTPREQKQLSDLARKLRNDDMRQSTFDKLVKESKSTSIRNALAKSESQAKALDKLIKQRSKETSSKGRSSGKLSASRRGQARGRQKTKQKSKIEKDVDGPSNKGFLERAYDNRILVRQKLLPSLAIAAAVGTAAAVASSASATATSSRRRISNVPEILTNLDVRGRFKGKTRPFTVSIPKVDQRGKPKTTQKRTIVPILSTPQLYKEIYGKPERTPVPVEGGKTPRTTLPVGALFAAYTAGGAVAYYVRTRKGYKRVYKPRLKSILLNITKVGKAPSRSRGGFGARPIYVTSKKKARRKKRSVKRVKNPRKRSVKRVKNPRKRKRRSSRRTRRK